ncbi:Hypothetical_protein [Hexamita inflata]|uniref:Hypothetical_protein n=1 Tax=Hexamita inflata TaxID=28002 RepID=A0AA86V556_9EUKA|nr:Hypothetical protein HINF_LOCUS44763 [Hexamita inflata]
MSATPQDTTSLIKTTENVYATRTQLKQTASACATNASDSNFTKRTITASARNKANSSIYQIAAGAFSATRRTAKQQEKKVFAARGSQRFQRIRLSATCATCATKTVPERQQALLRGDRADLDHRNSDVLIYHDSNSHRKTNPQAKAPKESAAEVRPDEPESRANRSSLQNSEKPFNYLKNCYYILRFHYNPLIVLKCVI